MGLELYSISSYEKKCIVTLSISYDLVTNNSKSSVTMTQIWFVFFFKFSFFYHAKTHNNHQNNSLHCNFRITIWHIVGPLSGKN